MSVACAALAASLIGLSSIALADDAMMAKPAMPAHMATMVCRAASSDEKATAMMGTKALVCKPLDQPKAMEMKKSLEAMPGGDPIWVKMLEQLQIGSSNN